MCGGEPENIFLGGCLNISIDFCIICSSQYFKRFNISNHEKVLCITPNIVYGKLIIALNCTCSCKCNDINAQRLIY